MGTASVRQIDRTLEIIVNERPARCRTSAKDYYLSGDNKVTKRWSAFSQITNEAVEVETIKDSSLVERTFSRDDGLDDSRNTRNFSFAMFLFTLAHCRGKYVNSVRLQLIFY